MFRISVDLDGTICKNKVLGQSYEHVEPIEGAIETLKLFKERGYYVIINTARNMVTLNGNVGKINKYQMPIILDWLRKYDVPYDELVVGKPHVDFFLDDKSIEFKGDWEEMNQRMLLEENKKK
jgi:capsule biosynthesis phosphatase